MYNTKKITPAVVEFVDIAGLVKGASKGEGLGNKFLANIRETDAIVHVVRCFEDENVTHVDSSIDPLRDIETINLELIFADAESVKKRLDRAINMTKTGDKKYRIEADFLQKLYDHLEKGLSARTLDTTDDEKEIMKDLFLISNKPVIYTANIAEKDMGKDEKDLPLVQKVIEFAKSEGARHMVICAKTEEELSMLDPEEQQMFLSDLGVSESGLDKLVKTSYDLLGLISYLTAGPQEVRARTITKGTKAPQAAGKIHSDFERGFIRAEVVAFDDLVKEGSMNAARKKDLYAAKARNTLLPTATLYCLGLMYNSKAALLSGF
jgi:GTP-binding protein YchF